MSLFGQSRSNCSRWHDQVGVGNPAVAGALGWAGLGLGDLRGFLSILRCFLEDLVWGSVPKEPCM
jgi:hypothetical protein